jgi:hypothetical protein
MSQRVNDYVQLLEKNAEKAGTKEGYSTFVQYASALLISDPEFARNVLLKYHQDGAHRTDLPCLSIVHDGQGNHLLVQEFEDIKKGACSATPSFAKATGYYEK